MPAGDFRTLEGFCLTLSEVGVGAGDVGAGDVLTLHRLCFLLLDKHTAVSLCLLLTLGGRRFVASDLNLAVTVGRGHTDGTLTVRVGHVDERLVVGLGGRLATDVLDVVRFVGDVGDVHVDEVQTDLVEFSVNVLGHQGEEGLTVLVDLLDGQRGNGQTQLTEDDLLGHVFDGLRGQTKQTLGSIGHDLGLGGDTDGEGRWDVDADVLHREGVAQVDDDRQRLEVKVGVVLDERDDQTSATVNGVGRLALEART